MIIEMRTYTVQPHKLRPWFALWEAKAMPVQVECAASLGGRFLGMYLTEFGALNDVVHLWQHQDLEARAKARRLVEGDARWDVYIAEVEELCPMIVMRNTILRATPFSPQELTVVAPAPTPTD